jgi:DEAD/DEAH box helicase domain-containing protein
VAVPTLQMGERRPLGDGGSVQDVREPAGAAAFSDVALPPRLAEALARRGVERLYAHQAETIEAVRAGRSVILCAPTASGKTEAYLVPAVEAAWQGRRTLLLFPTKALARDQLGRFAELEPLGVRAAVYDGDTPEKERKRFRQDPPHLVLTNPDMLHFMLLGSRSFREVWATLGLLVLDDVHAYTGAFGGHVAQIVKRLRRMCAVRGAKLQVVACSATIRNPAEFALGLLSQKLKVVSGEVRRSPVLHRIVNPPFVGRDRRESHLTRTLRVLEDLLEARRKILVFANAHVTVEALGMMAAERGIDAGIYRAGLLDADRRALEDRFRAGDLRVLVTTSALELGIDVGAVDAVVLAGYPGSATRVRQRIGRAGRKGQEALAVLVARDNPLDQYFVDHPLEYVAGEPESAYVHAQSPEIARPHLVAFVRDLPDEAEWIERFFPDGEALLAQAVADGLVTQRPSDGRWIPTKEGIARVFRLNLRGTEARVRIVDLERDATIGDRERDQAMLELFPGAIYLHGGRRHRVMFLDLERGVAGVRPAPGGHVRTSPLFDRDAEVLERLAERTCHGAPLAFGRVRIATTVYGYVRRDLWRGTVIDRRELAEPLVFDLETQGLWLDLPPAVVASVASFPEGLHAVEHTAIHMLPTVTGADPSETGGLSYPSGRMFVYDGFPGGSGLTRVAYERLEEALAKALDRLARCPCERGCPACILDAQCGNANAYLDRTAGREILERLLGVERELPGIGPAV